MPRISGVVTKKNNKGLITHITIDVKKFPELIQPILKHTGLDENSDFLEAKKGYTSEQARARTMEFIDSLSWEK